MCQNEPFVGLWSSSSSSVGVNCHFVRTSHSLNVRTNCLDWVVCCSPCFDLRKNCLFPGNRTSVWDNLWPETDDRNFVGREQNSLGIDPTRFMVCTSRCRWWWWCARVSERERARSGPRSTYVAHTFSLSHTHTHMVRGENRFKVSQTGCHLKSFCFTIPHVTSGAR